MLDFGKTQYAIQLVLPGSLPAFDNLKIIRYPDFSRNKLRGQIPQNMVRLSRLLNLNLSFNNFEGAVPLDGVFQNASGIHVSGNLKLCGGYSRAEFATMLNTTI